MKKTVLAALALLAFVLAPLSIAQEGTLARILELGKQDNRAMEHLRTLAKTIGPRLTGTDRYDRAARWAEGELRSYGLAARLETWGEFRNVFERGHSTGGMVAPEHVDYTFITWAWTPGTDGAKRGPAILEPSSDEALEAAKDRLAGSWIVDAQPPPAGKIRRLVREAAAEAGALGYLHAGPKNGRLVMAGSPRVELEEIEPQVRIHLLAAQHDDLRRRLEAGESVELEFDVHNRLAPGPVPCTNVVADLLGSESPDEFVIVGGHLDSWDAAEGAQDNATGCVSAIEAARLIAAAGGRPRRTIRVVLFGGEEQGLLGSKGYVDEHADELERTSLALIHDGGGTAIQGLGTTYAMLDDFRRVFAPVASLHPRFPFEVEETDGLVNPGDSDHAPFLRAGVPGFFWRQSERGYERVHHTQFDVLESVDPEELEHSAVVVAVAAFGFAELDHLLDRTDMRPLDSTGRGGGRRMGVVLEGTTVQDVLEESRAGRAAWQDGDVILSIDGVEVKDRESISRLLREGGPKKVFRLKRGESFVESTLDWSEERSAGGDREKERAERAARRDAWLRAHGAK